MDQTNMTWMRNHAALAQHHADLAARLAQTHPADLTWCDTRQDVPSASMTLPDGRSLALASRYNPQQEAQRLIEAIDLQKTACVVVMGVGLGHHVAALAELMKDRGLLLVFEPDLALFRAVLEKIDHSRWLGADNVILADTQTDRTTLITRLERFSSVVTQGTQLISHPTSRQRDTEAFKSFGQMITDTLAYCRTTIATALVNASRTCHNLACNLPHYGAGASVNELYDAAHGYPAVCIGAGPSLVKNVDLLRNPDVRKNVVVISVQTTLKPLLDRGIRPDFVTALDYSAICQRFYENLPPLPDVTLVAEPKANPIILDSFPGPIRVCHSQFNDQLLGKLARPIVPMPGGATVAHLSFYLAQFLGCDPIMFIGQDLGFSDGLYYALGTAVHNVWSSELNTFNTIEMMEWQRIVRHKGNLQREQDIHGQPIFTDEQMITYLKQFERDFAKASQTIIDATEGGMPKQHTKPMPLSEALAQYATRPVPKLPVPSLELNPNRLDELVDLLRQRIRQVTALRRTTLDTIPILKQMIKHQRNGTKMSQLFEQLGKNQKRVEAELNDAFQIASQLNAVGAFKRARADRLLQQVDGDELDKQQRQIERDKENLQWLVQSCDETLTILRAALDRTRQFAQQKKQQAIAA